MWTQSCPVVVEAEIGEMHLQVQEREAPRPQGAQPCRPPISHFRPPEP